jgi:small subunit ribosomal protein S1
MNDQDTQEKQELGQETPDSVAISDDTQDTPSPQEAQTDAAEAPPADAPQAAAEGGEAPPEEAAPAAEASSPEAEEPQETPAEPQEAAAKPQEAADEKKGFGEILAEFEHDAPKKKRDEQAAGSKVSGKILSVGEEWVFVDVGGKSEGRIAAAELKDAEGNLTVKEGDTLEATITGTDPESGALLLKRKAGGKGKRTEVSAEIKGAFESGLPVDGVVTGLNKGGAEVQVYGMRAFCPLSQLDLRYVEDPQRFVGQKLQFKISRLEEGNRGGRGPNIVLSRRALLEDEQQTKASETREKLQVGATLTGKITSLTTYGAFVDLGGIEGMLHVSEIGHSRTAHPQDVFTVGQEVEVQVIKIEKGKDEKRPERISLSRRALEKDPWRDAVSRFPEGTETTGKVARTETFGAFVELAPGLEGLVHISEIGGGRRLNHAREAVQPGQEVQVRVLGVDTARRRISLSMSAVGGGGGDRSERSDRGGGGGDRAPRGDRDNRRDDRREEYASAGSSTAAGSGFGSMADFFSRSKKK